MKKFLKHNRFLFDLNSQIDTDLINEESDGHLNNSGSEDGLF